MPPPIPASSKRVGGASRTILIFVGVIVLFPLLLTTLLAGRHLLLARKINKKLAQIRSSHEPITGLELASYYEHLPLDTNGAALYKQAFTAIRNGASHKFLEDTLELFEGTNALPTNLRQSMVKAVADNQAAFAPLHKAATFGPCRFPIDYTNGWWTLLLHLRDIPVCARLELCDGALKAQSGDVDGSIKSVELICKYADSLNDEPDFNAAMIQGSIDNQAYNLSFWLLNHRNLSVAQLATLQKIFGNREPAHWVDRSIIGDRCATLILFDQPPGYLLSLLAPGDPKVSDVLRIWLMRFLGRGKLDELTYLNRLDDIRAAANLPFPESLDRADSLTTAIRTEARANSLYVTGGFLPPFLRSIRRDALHLARMRLIELALSIEQYRIQHRTLPEDLDSLNLPDETILIDPFDGQQIRYETSRQGYKLYSVGPDRNDDGGKVSIELYSKEQVPLGDITASVER